MTADPQEPMAGRESGVVLVRHFHTNDEGTAQTYVIDDPRLPQTEHYFIVSTKVVVGSSITDRWKPHHGPHEVFPGLAPSDVAEAIDQCFAHAGRRGVLKESE